MHLIVVLIRVHQAGLRKLLVAWLLCWSSGFNISWVTNLHIFCISENPLINYYVLICILCSSAVTHIEARSVSQTRIYLKNQKSALVPRWFSNKMFPIYDSKLDHFHWIITVKGRFMSGENRLQNQAFHFKLVQIRNVTANTGIHFMTQCKAYLQRD